MIGWLRHQTQALLAAQRRLLAQPVATLLAALAMGVAVSLPSALYLGLGTLNRLAGNLPASPEISVFLDGDTAAADRAAIATRLKQSDIAQARYVPKEEALATLSAAQDLADIAAGLAQNPLPDAWVVRPHASSREQLDRLALDLDKLPGVAETHLDSQWAGRLQAALALGRTVVWVLAGLFAIALTAISGNAIRAQVLARHNEIQVSRLIGATDRHIRRPFLYLGALQGLLGGLAAGVVLAVVGVILRAPVERLAALYGSSFHLLPPTVIEIVGVLGLTTLFGWLGAWLTVSRTLRLADSAA
ncbi:MAG: permease-like cell division protein FtsX [Thiobacillus sp.]|uniref:permease-like cell division protein FtsX n=1 Tax=Thiobacillus sp. TaxID=924 RepID=UPI0028949C9E|nr:permease-like cell division protein FtsX [Thiobacillus sp.]MDT3706824.1 permease-like cell division protein FtsX [Thiobacillus sp.]